MPYATFHHYFPEIAEKETRTMTIIRDDDVIPKFDRGHIATDLFNSTQYDDTNITWCKWGDLYLFLCLLFSCLTCFFSNVTGVVKMF